MEKLYNFHDNTGGTDNAKYCYAVWMRHLIYAHKNGMKSIPNRIAELGPGDSLGIGLSALLSGANYCVALDIVKFTNAQKNLEILDQLIPMFQNKVSIPTPNEFPNMKPSLENYDFPSHIITDEILQKALHPLRIQKIKDSILAIDNAKTLPSAMILYKAPWMDANIIDLGTTDMIISQAVLQHIDKISEAYQCMNMWLKPNGFMSHAIDLKSMGSADTWDGHWEYSNVQWKIVRGRKNYLINRIPYSKHIELLQKNNFTIVCDIKHINPSSFTSRKQLASDFASMSDDDLQISGMFIQAIKIN